MKPEPIWITIIAAMISGLVGALLSTVVYLKRENRKFKVDTLKRFAANRFDLKGDEFSRALNEIYIVFNDSAKVMNALSDFHKALTSRQNELGSQDTLVKLFKAMCKDVKIKHGEFTDSFFLIPFNTKPNCRL